MPAAPTPCPRRIRATPARRPGARAGLGEVREKRAIAENLARRWSRAATAYARDCRTDTQVLLGRVAPALLHPAAERRADLLAIGAVQHRPAVAAPAPRHRHRRHPRRPLPGTRRPPIAHR